MLSFVSKNLVDERTMKIQQVIENAKSLSFNDRALVAHCLISSLETKQDECVEQEWIELAKEGIKSLFLERLNLCLGKR